MKDKLANPAPLGLLGFGMTTVLLNIHNAGFFPISAMILAMGIFYGGLAQVIAGLIEYKKGNTFGATAFTSYGLFWFSLIGLLLLPEMGLAEATPDSYMGWYLVMWAVLTLVFFVGTFNKNRALQFIFGSLTLLLILLAVRDFSRSETVGEIAGWVGIVGGASAMYLAFAEILNENYGRTILPVGEPKKKK
jgi:succinate-acetate transporter protein